MESWLWERLWTCRNTDYWMNIETILTSKSKVLFFALYKLGKITVNSTCQGLPTFTNRPGVRTCKKFFQNLSYTFPCRIPFPITMLYIFTCTYEISFVCVCVCQGKHFSAKSPLSSPPLLICSSESRRSRLHPSQDYRLCTEVGAAGGVGGVGVRKDTIEGNV